MVFVVIVLLLMASYLPSSYLQTYAMPFRDYVLFSAPAMMMTGEQRNLALPNVRCRNKCYE